MFMATEFSSIDDKIKFEKQFKKFVTSGFKRSQFPKWFYTRLSMCFGMIAHYNHDNFYATYFDTRDGRQEFVDQCLRCQCYGDPAFTYSDVERTLVQWLREQSFQGE